MRSNSIAFHRSDVNHYLQKYYVRLALGEADEILVQVYRGADDEEVRQAALEGMLISGNDTAVLQLYRETDDVALKRELLEMLSIMGSDEVWDLIDEALEGQR